MEYGVTLTEAVAVLKNLVKGNQVFGVEYYREQPKCLKCGKRFDREKATASCCGVALSYITKDTCKFHVKNPGKGITKPGEGVRVGESADTAWENGRVKYYSFTRVGDRTDEKKGGYRQFVIENLIRFTDHNGNDYIIVK